MFGYLIAAAAGYFLSQYNEHKKLGEHKAQEAAKTDALSVQIETVSETQSDLAQQVKKLQSQISGTPAK